MLELVAWGALYGFLTILVVFLSKGRDKFMNHITIMLFGTVTGIFKGVAIYFL